MWGGSALLLSRLLPVGPAGSRPAPGRWAVAAAGAAQHPRDRITPEHSNLKTPAHMPWGYPRPKSGAIGAQILKFSKECHGTLLRIFLQYP